MTTTKKSRLRVSYVKVDYSKSKEVYVLTLAGLNSKDTHNEIACEVSGVLAAILLHGLAYEWCDGRKPWRVRIATWLLRSEARK